ncbi:MAG TPA: ParB N-terminal domain-containing protein [Dissulfurispiraceae bacterium]|nr:ParB N-terminal domain-containing protein [Dissulfurispiraceae bacterium]
MSVQQTTLDQYVDPDSAMSLPVPVIPQALIDCLEQSHDQSIDERVLLINELRKAIARYSPFSNEPVDCVLWVKPDKVRANDYNPNTVAPPEMELLRVSIGNDGFTQPIVAWEAESDYEVVDGFHRNRVVRECDDIRERLHGHMPLAVINSGRSDRGDRIASTIRHNRARGKHKIAAMSDIVVELRRRNWSETKIGRELGMDPDEVLRLTQITGLAEMFANRDFSKAWEADEGIMDDEISGVVLSEVIEDE